MKAAWLILKIVFVLYAAMLALAYFIQERFIFFPEKLDRNTSFAFPQPFEEMNFKMKDGIRLNGLLFKADTPKGLIFYLHGNAGSLRIWGDVADVYTALHYDVMILDYRGFGKSEGSIRSEAQLHQDIQQVYDSLKQRYAEEKIVVLGYSIGTCPAARLASANNPKLLILQAPYYSLFDLMRYYYPFLPTFLLKYKLETNKYVAACKMPVVIFHGDMDMVVGYSSSVKLKRLLKPGDTLITLHGAGHLGMTDNPEYLATIGRLLEQ